MKKILQICIIGILFLSSYGAVALNSDVEKAGSETIDYETSGNGRLDFTHTILAEFGTTSSCPHCPPVSGYLYNIYSSGDYDFCFLTLNADKEPLANARYWEIPGSSGSVPQVFFDGGYSTLIGNQGSKTPYINKIVQAGARSVPDIDLDLLVEWQGDAEMKVTVSVTNNEGSSYDGHLHAYITEISSRWYDNSGNKYHFSMIGYAFNKNIEVAAGDTWSEFVTWDGDSHGYGNIEEDNIMVIASVFDPSTKYVDETVSATPGGGSGEKPDLFAEGSLVWKDITPGETVEGTFIVKNVGASGSQLDWEISSKPNWGTWTCNPDSGIDLTPEDGEVEVEVSCVAPSDKNKHLSGRLKVENLEDSEDYYYVSVVLKTPVYKSTFMLQILQNLIQRFPILEKILSLYPMFSGL